MLKESFIAAILFSVSVVHAVEFDEERSSSLIFFKDNFAMTVQAAKAEVVKHSVFTARHCQKKSSFVYEVSDFESERGVITEVRATGLFRCFYPW